MVKQESMVELLGFLVETSRALLECGCSANRVELLLGRLGDAYQYEVEALAVPTGVLITIRKDGTNLVDLSRVRSWSVDLDRLARLNALVDSIYDGRTSVADGRKALKEEAAIGHPYPMWLTLLCGGMASSVLAYFYGAGALEIALTFPGGVAVQVIQRVFAKSEARRYVADFVSAMVAAFYCYGCSLFSPQIDPSLMIVASIIVIIPGLVFVNAVHEIAQKNLVSGSAKLLDALVVTAALASGVSFAVIPWLLVTGKMSAGVIP